MGYKDGGLDGRYVLKAEDGDDLPGSYFVLRYDRDPHARKALLVYAESVRGENEELYRDLLDELERCWD
jgi:hypothetical protein